MCVCGGGGAGVGGVVNTRGQSINHSTVFCNS